MRICLAVCVSLLTPLAVRSQPSRAHPSVSSLTTSTVQVVPLVTIGDGWTQRFVLQNVDLVNPSSGTLTFFNSNGGPMAVDMAGIGSSNQFTFTIEVGRTVIFQTVPNSSPLQIGWASLQLNAAGPGNTFGQIVFRKQSPGLPDFMCSMVLGGLAYTKLSTFFDNTGSNYTGMGIVTCAGMPVCSGNVNLQVTVRDISGVIVSQKIITQRQGSLYWMNLATDFPETGNRMGTFEVQPLNASTTTLTGISLQFAANGAFTMITPFEN